MHAGKMLTGEASFLPSIAQAGFLCDGIAGRNDVGRFRFLQTPPGAKHAPATAEPFHASGAGLWRKWSGNINAFKVEASPSSYGGVGE